MRRFVRIAAAGLAALTFAGSAQAATVIATINGATGSFSNPSVACTDPSASLPCSFSDTVTFTTPTGYNSLSAILNSTFNTDNPLTNLDFGTVTFNNGALDFTFNVVNDVFDQASRTLIPLIAGNTNTLTITGSSAGQTSYSATLSFAAVSGVPEPATWALMLLGFGAIGFSLRRRNGQAHLLQAA